MIHLGKHKHYPQVAYDNNVLLLEIAKTAATFETNLFKITKQPWLKDQRFAWGTVEL